MSITAIDIVFFILILILLVRGFLRGFVKEFMTMASVVLGLVAAILLYKPGGQFIRNYINMKVIPEILAFIAIFIIVYFFVIFVEYLLGDIIKRINIGWLDSTLGMLFGIIEGVVMVTVILLVLSIQPLFDPAVILEDSFFYNLFQPLVFDARRMVDNVL